MELLSSSYSFLDRRYPLKSGPDSNYIRDTKNGMNMEIEEIHLKDKVLIR